MTTGKRSTNVLTVALVAMGIVGGTVGTASAGPITINNADFANSGGGPAGGGTPALVDDWNEENAGSVFLDNAGLANKPEADAVLYLNAVNAAVNQDLSHNWASSDSYTLDIIAHNPNWDSTGEFKIQLREADGDVLWDSGPQSVDGTVSGASYTGTGHIFNWSIDASTFSGAGVVEGSQLNIRILCTSNTVYADDIALTLVDPPATPGTLIYGK